MSNTTPLNDPCIDLPLGASSDETIAEREFKNAMARIAFSIAVVTAKSEQEELGRTVTSFMPLSVNPPRIIVSIDAHSRLVDLITASTSFSVSFLAVGQEHVADAFAGKWGKVNRFGISSWARWPSGNRRLVDAVVSLDCTLTATINVVDHILFVGTIIDVEDDGRAPPLIWHERSYTK